MNPPTSSDNRDHKAERRIPFYSHLLVCVFLIVAALILRFSFLQTPQLPVVWDAAGYHIQAKTFKAAFGNISDEEFFHKEFRRAFDMASFKGEVYPLFLTLVYSLGDVDAPFARNVQAVLDSLMCMLIYLIAWHVFRRQTISLAAGLFCVLYIPFIFSVGRLLTETLGILLVILMVWLLYKGIARRGWIFFLLAGLVAALVMVCRTSFQYIVPFVVLGMLCALWGEKWQKNLLLLMVFLCGVIVIIGPRLYYTNAIYDTALLSGSWKNGEAVFSGIHPDNQGFQAEALARSSELNEVIRTRPGSSSIQQSDYYRAYIRTVLKYPIHSISIIASKGFSFYKRPYNDFMQEFLIPWTLFTWFHRIIFILALFGIPLSLRYWPRSSILLAIFVYLSSMALLADLEIRYGLPVMPFLSILAAVCLYYLIQAICHIVRRKKFRHYLLPLLTCGVLFCLSRFVTIPFLKNHISSLSLGMAHMIHEIIICLFWISLIVLVYTAGRNFFTVRFSLLVSCLPVLLMAIGARSYSSINPYWHEWSVRLKESGQIVRQVIDLPSDIDRYRRAELKIDMLSGGGDGYDLDISIDGTIVRRYRRGLTMDWDHYIRTRKAFSTYLKYHRRKLGDLKQWFTVLIPKELLDGKERITVDITLSATGGGERDYVDIFGDYMPVDNPLWFEGPSLERNQTTLSPYKYAVEDEWRIWERSEISSPATGAFYDGIRWHYDDLSTSPGRQEGRYRLFLTYSRKGGPGKEMPQEVSPEEVITKRVTIPAHRRQVWMVYPEQKKTNRIKVEMAHAAPGTEGGFFILAYTDTNGGGLPDRLVTQSPFLTSEKAGEWSEWEFSSEEPLLFVGNSWNKPTKVYYDQGEWPHNILGATMHYSNNQAAPRLTAPSKVTNLRISFIKEVPQTSGLE